jgi:hypothetical protein
VPLAEKIRNTPLSIGIPPILITVGVEFGGGTPNVELLSAMASRTEEGNPLYFHIDDADRLVEFLSTTGSSSASTPDEIFDLATKMYPDWKRLPPPEDFLE